MKQFVSRLPYLRLSFWSGPLVLLCVLFLAFGLLIPWLGYGYDEWHFVYYATRGSEGLLELFHYDGHPQAVWSYVLWFNWLGYQPQAWHILSLTLRGVAVLVFLWVFHLTWPDRYVQNLSASLIFAIYPFFTLQILPISYSEVWLSFILLGLSFAFSLLSVRNSSRFILFTGLAIFFKVGHIFTSEYTWFLEVIRPALLWFALPAELFWKDKVRRVIWLWLPNFLLFMTSTIWRGFFYIPTRTTFRVQSDVFGNPIDLIIAWFVNAIPDAALVLFTSWFTLFSPDYLRLDNRENIYLLAMTLLIVVGLFAYFYYILDKSQTARRWAFQAALVGSLAILFGVLPFYIGGYTIYLSKAPINSRFALGFLPGAALFVAAMLEILITSRRIRYFVLAVLVGFSISWHVRYTNEARNLWAVQSDFFKQLLWRVPGIQPGTVVHLVEPFTDFPKSPAQVLVTGDFAYAMALNAIYQTAPKDATLAYWFLSTSPISADPGVIQATHATTTFESVAKRNLYLYFAPLQGECLRVLQPIDSEYRHYPETLRQLASQSSLAAISLSGTVNRDVTKSILREDSETHRWCYYYQKAELARQSLNWDEIIVLWEKALDQNLRPRHGMEFLPFVEAYARLSDFETAIMLSKHASKISRGMNSPLCSLWREVSGQTPIFERVKDAFDCAP